MPYGLDEYDHLWLEKGDRYPGGPCSPIEPGYLQIKRFTFTKIVDAKFKPTFALLKPADSDGAVRPNDGKKMKWKFLRAMSATKFAKCQIARNEYPQVGPVSEGIVNTYADRDEHGNVVPPSETAPSVVVERVFYESTIIFGRNFADLKRVNLFALLSGRGDTIPLVQVKNNIKPHKFLRLSLNQAAVWLHLLCLAKGTQVYPASPIDTFADVQTEKVYLLQGSVDVGNTDQLMNETSTSWFQYKVDEETGETVKYSQFPFYVSGRGILTETTVSWHEIHMTWSWNPYVQTEINADPGFCRGCEVPGSWAMGGGAPRLGLSGAINFTLANACSDGTAQDLGDWHGSAFGLVTIPFNFQGLWTFYKDIAQLSPFIPDAVKAIPITYGPTMGLTIQVAMHLNHFKRDDYPREGDINPHVIFGPEPPPWFGA